MYLREVGCEGRRLLQLTQDLAQGLTLVLTMLNCRAVLLEVVSQLS
jgi:hypothetical protein